MFPKPPQLFRGKGVTDDPASETYWKAANGIRPSFKTNLTDTQLWQVSELLAHANEIPEAVKTVLVPDSPTSQDTRGPFSILALYPSNLGHLGNAVSGFRNVAHAALRDCAANSGLSRGSRPRQS